MIILGIDAGLNVAGYALLKQHGARRTVLSTGTLSADQKRPWFERLDVQTTEFAALIADCVPELLAFENYVYQGPRSHNPQSLWLARLVGRYEGIARTLRLPFVTVDKSACNRAIGLKGKTDAARIRKMIAMLFPALAFVRTDHECDAIAVAVAGCQRVSMLGRVA